MFWQDLTSGTITRHVKSSLRKFLIRNNLDDGSALDYIAEAFGTLVEMAENSELVGRTQRIIKYRLNLEVTRFQCLIGLTVLLFTLIVTILSSTARDRTETDEPVDSAKLAAAATERSRRQR